MEGAAICIGLDERRQEMVTQLREQQRVPVSSWPNLSAVQSANMEGLFTADFRALFKLVVLDRSYSTDPETRGQPLPHPGAGATLPEQVRAAQELFPNAKVVFVTDHYRYLTNEASVCGEALPEGTGLMSYASLWSQGMNGVARSFKDYLER